jgi:hypothetical protein
MIKDHFLQSILLKYSKEGKMSEKEKQDVWVRVKDNAGNEFICPLNALKERKSATDEELENCVDDAVVGRYAGHIDISE